MIAVGVAVSIAGILVTVVADFDGAAVGIDDFNFANLVDVVVPVLVGNAAVMVDANLLVAVSPSVTVAVDNADFVAVEVLRLT